MTIEKIKYKSRLIFALLWIPMVFLSCSDDSIKEGQNDGNENSGTGIKCEGYELAFMTSLDVPSGVAEEETYDDYVETKDHFRIFFFDKDGRFMVNSMDRTVTPLGTDDDGRKKFFVRIPMNYIVDRNDNQFDVDKLKKKLKEEPFKIAILANWPNPEGNPESPDVNERSPRFPNWGWDNSILNDKATNIKNINDLHHLREVTEIDFYKRNVNKLGFLMRQIASEGGSKYYRGITTDWVEAEKNNFKGKKVDESNLIPMYGVQDFDALKDFWEEGTTFFLSESSYLETHNDASTPQSYQGKDIFLLRSLAKIEVFMNNKPEEGLWLYNFNREAYCEPVDVESPTDKYWDYENINHGSKVERDFTSTPFNKDLDCEWFLLGNNYKLWNHVKTDDSYYSSWLSWFYGCWATGKFYFNDNNTQGWNFNSVSLPVALDYPHVFNPAISPFTSAQMIYEGEVDIWHKYVFYMPEKFMDDYNFSEDNNEDLFIPYIQYKRHNQASALRFYFADEQPETKDREKVLNCKLWPILRNHVYRFYVQEAQPEEETVTIIVRARVSDWGYNRLETNIW